MNKTMLCPRCWGSGAEPEALRSPCVYCGGDGWADDLRLSENFWLSEFVDSPSALRTRTRNDPTPQQVERLRQLCRGVLQPVRDRFGPIEVTSGFRSLEVNTLNHGSKNSAHMSGWAADIRSKDAKASRKPIIDWLIASGLAYDQVIYEGTWIHVGLYRPPGSQQRREALMYRPGAKPEYPPYNPRDPRVR